MISKMKITYRSKMPCSAKPAVFSTGGYAVDNDGGLLCFDFEDMSADCRFEDGFLFIDAVQETLDESIWEDGDMDIEAADAVLRTIKKKISEKLLMNHSWMM